MFRFTTLIDHLGFTKMRSDLGKVREQNFPPGTSSRVITNLLYILNNFQTQFFFYLYRFNLVQIIYITRLIISWLSLIPFISNMYGGSNNNT